MRPRERLKRGVAVPWSPWNIPRSQRPLYLGAADLAATPVDTWTGWHGGLSFTASSDARPAWSATGFAGAYPGVTADGVDDVMTAAATTGLPTGTDPCVVAMLVSGVAIGDSSGVLVAWGGTASGTYRRILLSSSGLGFNIHGGTQQATAADLTSVVAPTVIVGTATGIGTASATFVLRVNGEEVARYTGSSAGTTSTTRTRLFANTANTPAGFIQATVSELLIGTTWTDRQIQQFEGYCAHAYPLAGIVLPDGHPYQSGAP